MLRNIKSNRQNTWHYIFAKTLPRSKQNQRLISREPARTVEDGLDKVYSGINPNGAGFVFDAAEKRELIENCPDCEVFFHPYLSSNDLNGDPNSEPTRFIVDVGLLSEEELRQYPPLYIHLTNTVKIERQKSSERRLREQWWKFSRPAQDLYNRIGDYDRVLAMRGFWSEVQRVYENSLLSGNFAGGIV